MPVNRRGYAIILLAWLAFAVLLAFAIFRHRMWSDELQAFLIARDSNSLAELFRNLKHEGHPALWHLLLMIPSHISWNPLGMQILNYLLALAEAWLILSVRGLQPVVRILLIFSFTLFYTDATLSRSYMLAALLLTAALLSYSSARKMNYLTILFLALAIQTHFFAIPIALLLAIGVIWPQKTTGASRHVRTGEALLLAAVLAASTWLAYLTIRPPADEYLPHYGKISYPPWHNILVSLSGLWAGIFIPYPLIHASGFLTGILPDKDHAPPLAICLSILCLLFATLLLRTTRARVFFLLAAVAEIVAFALTVHLPDLRHYGMIFVAFVLALILDSWAVESHDARLQVKLAGTSVLLVSFLALQAAYGFYEATREWIHPYSNAHDAALWLREAHLDQSPLVIVGASGPSIVGYLERKSVFYAACDCEGSFYKYSRDWDFERSVSAEEITQLDVTGATPVVVVSNRKLQNDELAKLHLREIKEFSGEVIGGSERYFIYQENLP